MNNFFIQQWVEAVKDGTQTITNAMETSSSEYQNFIGAFWNLDGFAQIGKAYLDSDNKINKTRESVLNSMLRSYLQTMDMKSMADAIKELNDIRADAFGRLAKTYHDWVNIFWSSYVNQMESFKKVNNYQEAGAVVMNELSDTFGKMKNNFMDSIQIWTGIETATKSWTNRMVNTMAASTQTTRTSGKSQEKK
jgi:hypothetical protein